MQNPADALGQNMISKTCRIGVMLRNFEVAFMVLQLVEYIGQISAPTTLM